MAFSQTVFCTYSPNFAKFNCVLSMSSQAEMSFENTEYAFAYKSNQELKKARFLFSTMGYDKLVRLGTRITPWAMRIGLPIKGLIRNTIFKQFVGGETLGQTKAVANRLDAFNVKVILDYGVEGKEGEDNFDHACQEFIRVIEYAGGQPNIPFISIKVTGFARFALLEKLHAASAPSSGFEGIIHTSVLTDREREEWERVVHRMFSIIDQAAKSGVGVLVDAEESWIQDPVDALTMQMMEHFNKDKAIVFNTVQLYRHDRLDFLKNSLRSATNNDFLLGVKLVRGAYMEKERERASSKGYRSPIQPDKESCDRDFNLALEYCMNNLDKLSVIIASHNEYSNLFASQLMDKLMVSHDNSRVHFSQLFGMSDNITFNLARAGFSVSKYLPFGPISDVIPYLMRRAQENSAVSGQTGRELALIETELKRRQGSIAKQNA